MAEYNYDYFDGRNIEVEEEHRRRILGQVDMRRRLRDTLDPFDISITEFMRVYRLPQHLVFELINAVAPYMPMRTHQSHVPLPLMVLCAIAFYASGSYQRGIGRIAELSVSQTSFSVFLAEVTDALNHPDVLGRFIRFPLTRAEREETIERNERLGLPRVLGFIDGTLVKIVPPSAQQEGQAYYCRKGYPALNVQVVCDADLRILDVNARYPGSCNDPFIYRYSGIRQEMQRAYRESRCWLLGDSGYGHEPWLHLPLPHAEHGTPEFSYTLLHCHCRNAVERCFGVLKGRWRCLLWDRTLHYDPVKSVNACAVLHNFCIERNVGAPADIAQAGNDDYDLDDVDGDLGDDEVDAAEHLDWGLVALANHELQYLIHFAHERYLRNVQR